jgi:Sulfocyanin (SoxE) domain
VLAALVALPLAVAACGGSSSGGGSSGGSSPAATASAPKFDPAAAPLSLTSDAASKTVKFTLVADYNSSNGGMNFNGYSQGALVISVPTGWTATVTCQNKGTINHSCAVVSGPGATQPSISGAGTQNPTAGLGGGQSGTFNFTAPSPVIERISCLVPGHEAAGMWITLRIVASGNPAASVTT